MSFRKILIVAALLAVKTEAVNIDCIFRATVGFPVIGTAYDCYATVTLTGNTNVESVTGVHLTGRFNDDVRAFRMYNQNMPSLPAGIADHFENLEYLEIGSSGLQSIRAKDLQPFPQLLVLMLYGNKLVNLDGDLFKFNTKLQWIHLSNNRIEHIGNDLVTHLSDLTALYLQSNVCINQYAYSRDAVVALAARLSTLCPPLETTTTTTVAPTTTELAMEKCSCVEEIQELKRLVGALRLENESQNLQIEKLDKINHQLNLEMDKKTLEQQENLLKLTAAFQKILKEVETHFTWTKTE